jgi:hypothetical protein
MLCFIILLMLYHFLFLSFSFPEIHRIVPLLQTCSTSEFECDNVYFCVCVYLLDLSFTYERKHAAFVFLSLTYHDVLQLHPFTFRAHVVIILYDQIKLHCVYIPHFLDPFISCRYLGCFRSLAVVNSAAMNIGVQVSLLYPDLCSFG